MHIHARATLVLGAGLIAWDATAESETPGEVPVAVPFEAYEALPDGDAESLAQLYWSAEEVPGIASLSVAHRRSLLDVVTERYKSRLVDRRPAPEELARHVERLADSPLVSRRPLALAQACAQYGLRDGACAPHAGYVRRAMVLEEMLASGRVTLRDLETELAGAPRPSLRQELSARSARADGTADR